MATSIDPQHELMKSQLQRAYDAAKAIYTSSLQFMTLAAGAEAALLTVGIERESRDMLLIGSIVLVALVFQLDTAGRRFASAMLTALSIERGLGVKPYQSVTRVFFSPAQFTNMLSDLDKIEAATWENPNKAFSSRARKYAPYNITRGITLLTFVFALLQAAGAVNFY